jgi:hypothetical protein
LDDVTIIATPSVALSTFKFFRQYAKEIGLHVNESKTQLLAPSCYQEDLLTQSANNLLPTPVPCIRLLGTFVGFPSACSQSLQESVQTNTYVRLQQLPGKQLTLLLLRHCINQYSGYMTRTSPPSINTQAVQAHDNLVKDTLASILELQTHDLTPLTTEESRLSLTMGGLGLSSASETKENAYLSSVTSVIQLWRKYVPDNDALFTAWLAPVQPTALHLDLHKSLQSARKIVSDSITLRITTTVNAANNSHPNLLAPLTGTPSSASSTTSTMNTSHQLSALRSTLPQHPTGLLTFTKTSKLQHSLNHAQSFIKYNQVKHQLTTAETRAQFLSKTGPAAHAFLLAIPNEQALRLSNHDMTIALRAYLRLEILPLEGIQAGAICACDRTDKNSNAVLLTEGHVFNCNAGSVMTTRHKAIVNTFHDMLTSVDHAVLLEPAAAPGTKHLDRFDFACCRVNSLGKNIKADVTIRNPLAIATITKASKTQLTVANIAVSEKEAHYKKYIGPHDIFLPLVFETFGAMHRHVRTLVAQSASRTQNTPPPHSTWATPTFTSYWIQRLSVCLWRENAQSVSTIAQLTKLFLSTGNSNEMGENELLQMDDDPTDPILATTDITTTPAHPL